MSVIRNVLPNPSAEVNTTGWEGIYGTLSRVENGPLADARGAWMLQASAGGANTSLVIRTAGAASARFPATPGQWVAARAQAAGVDMRVRAVIVFLSSAGTGVGTMLGPLVTVGAGAPVIHAAQAPATAVTYRVEWQASPVAGGTVTAGATFALDAAMVAASWTEDEARAAVASYADGDSRGWAWEGTPHASASRGPSDPYRPEAEVWRLGQRVAWIDQLDGFEEEATSGSRVQVSPLAGSARTTTVVRPAGTSRGTLTMRFFHELGDGRPGERAAALMDALATGAPFQLRIYPWIPGLATVDAVPTGAIRRRLLHARAGVWEVECDFETESAA